MKESIENTESIINPVIRRNEAIGSNNPPNPTIKEKNITRASGK